MSTAFEDLPEEFIVKILSFVPSRDLLATVSRVNWRMNRLVKTSSLWKHVHFQATDLPGYIAEVLARFSDSIRSVTLDTNQDEETEKIRVLVDSRIVFEEVGIVLCGAVFEGDEDFDFPRMFQLLGGSTTAFSYRQVHSTRHRRFIMTVPPDVNLTPKPKLTSLDLSDEAEIDDRVIEVIVASCPELELLRLGVHTYTSVGVRAIADGLPNLTCVSFSGCHGKDESIAYLLSRKPGLLAFGLANMDVASAPRTVAQLSRMANLQHLQLKVVNCSTIQAVFENRDFRQLKTLGLMDVLHLETAAVVAMAMACPNLEQLVLCGYLGLPRGLDDGSIKFIAESCPKLRAFFIQGSKEIRGDGWLDNIGTLLPQGQCFVVSIGQCWHEPSSPELPRKAEIARSRFPKLGVMIDVRGTFGGYFRSIVDETLTTHQFNDEIVISALDVLTVLQAIPRPCDLTARRVRFQNVLQQAARFKLSEDEADDACRSLSAWS